MKRLAFERLRIRRMPGILDGGFELEDLVPGLNVVHGPNASGKTTTASAIEALLWPSTAVDRAWLSASLRLDGEEWTVEADGRRARWQRAGLDASAPTLPPVEWRDRYRLSLHELLSVENKGFAEAIARESAGGYDLKAAAELLRPRSAPATRVRETDALKEARARLAQARGDQETLQGDERRLRDLEARIAERSQLDRRIVLLERAIEHARAREAASAAEAKLAGFDSRMEALTGQEAKELESIAGKLAAARDSLQTAERDEERAAADIAACNLSDGGLPPTLIPALEEELRAVQELARNVTTQEGKLREAEGRREQATRGIGAAIDAERLKELSTAGIESLAHFAREAEKLAAKRIIFEARLADSSGAEDAARARSRRETFEQGLFFLRKWLQSAPGGESSASRLRGLAIAGAVSSIVLGAVLAVVHPALAATALVGVLLLVLVRRIHAESDPRPVHRAEFEKLGLDAPQPWTVEGVESSLGELEREHSAAALAAERARIGAEAAVELAALAPQEEAIEARRAELTGLLGVDPRSSIGSLVWLVERIAAWHNAQGEAEGAGAALAAAREELAARLGAAGERVGALTQAGAADGAGLAGVVADLRRRQELFREASGRLALAHGNRTTASGNIAMLEEEIRAIFATARLEVAEEGVLRQWCDQHVSFRAAREDHALATRQRDALLERLTSLPEFDSAIADEDLSALTPRLETARSEAAELTPMREEAATIRAHIDSAKRSVAMEEALAEMLRCEDALRAARARDARSAIADALVSHLHSETRDHDRPAVFLRARAIFALITHGRYQLDLDGDSPAFRAIDTSTGVGHALDELSSATRVQLLLAVRIAFVETLEQDVQLPLMLDETLGNSDDDRALAIMEAVLELAGNGRQIFYFTAQPDEVGKWRGVVEGRGVPCAIIDLARNRQVARSVELPGLRIAEAPRREIPSPQGGTHREYGEALLVPAVDPFQPIDAVHLWYLVESPESLYHLLSNLGLDRWGQLSALVEYGSGSLVDAALLARIQARAKAMEVALDLRRVGRGLPVDRSVLIDSGVISSAFLDTITELCTSCGSDARRLMEAIESGGVKRFQAKVRESLREYLEGNRYLDDRPPLGPAEIRAATLASVQDEIRAQLLTVADVDRLLDLTAGPLVEADV